MVQAPGRSGALLGAPGAVHTSLYIQTCTNEPVHTHESVPTNMHERICTQAPVHTNLYVRTCTHESVHSHLYLQTCTHECVHPNLYLRACMHESVCTCGNARPRRVVVLHRSTALPRRVAGGALARGVRSARSLAWALWALLGARGSSWALRRALGRSWGCTYESVHTNLYQRACTLLCVPWPGRGARVQTNLYIQTCTYEPVHTHESVPTNMHGRI